MLHGFPAKFDINLRREVLKKKIVMIAIGLHVDVTPVLEQQGLSLKWLEDVPDPSAILNDIQAYDHPLEEFWDNLSTLFEDGVKGELEMHLGSEPAIVPWGVVSQFQEFSVHGALNE